MYSQVGRFVVNRAPYILGLVLVELFNLVVQVTQSLLVAFSQTRLGRLVLDAEQLEVFLDLDELLFSASRCLALQHGVSHA